MNNKDMLAATAFADLYNSAPCGLLTYTLEGKITYANERLLNWLGTSMESMKSMGITDLFEKGGKFYYQLFVEPSLKMHREVKEIDFSIQTFGGVSFPGLFSAVLCSDVGGNEYVHAAIYKVDNRKKYESELLRKKVQAETEKQVKSLALDEVAFDQAHLVGAPLANVLGLVSLMEQMEMPDELSSLFSMLRQSSENLDNAVKAVVNKIYRKSETNDVQAF